MSDTSTIQKRAMAAIREREKQLQADIVDPGVTEINVPRNFFHGQIGLRSVMLDPIGRFWDVSVNPIRMVLDPRKFR